MSIKNLMKQERQILSDIDDCFGEITDDQSELLDKIKVDIALSVDTYIDLLKNKVIDSEIKLIDDRIDELKKLKENRKKAIAFIEEELHSIIGKYYEINNDGIVEGYLVPTYSSRTERIEESLVPPELGRYEIALKYDEIQNYDKDRLSRKILVADLPEGHPAIIKKITPKVAFRVRKPKD
jgi:hypothetical protein